MYNNQGGNPNSNPSEAFKEAHDDAKEDEHQVIVQRYQEMTQILKPLRYSSYKERCYTDANIIDNATTNLGDDMAHESVNYIMLIRR